MRCVAEDLDHLAAYRVGETRIRVVEEGRSRTFNHRVEYQGNEAAVSSHEVGTTPVIVVPPPRVLFTAIDPPSAPSRSAIPCSPVPYDVVPASKPTPSSVTSKRSVPSPFASATCTCDARAYLPTFCSASSTQK